MNERQSRVSRTGPTILSVILAMTGADAASAGAGGDPHKRSSAKVLREFGVRTAVDAATELLTTLMQGRTEADTHAAARYFGIPQEEYQRWPEGRRRVVEAIYGAREVFHKRTIALTKTLETEDWELLERTASYVIVPTTLLPSDGFEKTQVFNELEPHEIVELHAMGILASAGSSGALMRFKPLSDEKLVVTRQFGHHALVMRFQNGNQVVKWPATPITKVGQELLPLLQRAPRLVNPEWNYVRALGEGIAKEGVTVELWEVSDVPNPGMLRFEKLIWALAGGK